MFDFFKNTFLNRGRYKTHSEAVVISCFYNPQNNPYRVLAFQRWYHSIKHLNHRIVECLIGPDAKPQLPSSPYITRVDTESLLWHKEALLNKIVSELPPEFRYVFWVDADVIFTNLEWLTQGVQALQDNMVIQPFEFCVHLDRNQTQPAFNVDDYRALTGDLERRHKKLWRSFASNYVAVKPFADNPNYDVHGHVGFAWGARREVLEQCPLYEKALIGGADHVLAHAAAGQIPHPCIIKGFGDNLNEVEEWSNRFHSVVQGKIGYVPGDLYHIWHGEIASRQYLKRVREFTPETVKINQKDRNGLYVAPGNNRYMKRYYRQREVGQLYDEGFDDFYIDGDFLEDMGYTIYDFIQAFSQPAEDYDDGGPVSDTPLDAGAVPLEMGGAGATDPTPVDAGDIPFDQDGAGRTDPSPIDPADLPPSVAEQLSAAGNAELDTAIFHASQPDVPESGDWAVPVETVMEANSGDDGNFS